MMYEFYWFYIGYLIVNLLRRYKVMLFEIENNILIYILYIVNVL